MKSSFEKCYSEKSSKESNYLHNGSHSANFNVFPALYMAFDVHLWCEVKYAHSFVIVQALSIDTPPPLK